MRGGYIIWGLMAATVLLMFVWPYFDPILTIVRLLGGALILVLLAMRLLFARQRRWWQLGELGLVLLLPLILSQLQPAPPPLPELTLPLPTGPGL